MADRPAAHNPLFDDAVGRTDKRAQGGAEAWHDPREDGTLPDAYIAMGQTAENVAAAHRHEPRRSRTSSACAARTSPRRRIADGFWAKDITPVTLPDGTVVSTDDGPRAGVTYEAVSQLKPVFRPDGTITAGNCCALNDGAAAVVIMSDTKAKELGLTPLARIVSHRCHGPVARDHGPRPGRGGQAGARPRRAWASTTSTCSRSTRRSRCRRSGSAQALGIDIDKLNVNGGAIAVGHPFGMTGARITSTLINSLQHHDKQFGVETMCVGGGQGMAMVLERLS